MFLETLDDRQRRALVVMAHHMMVADHTVTDEEMDLIRVLENELTISTPLSAKELYAPADMAAFVEPRSKVAAVLKLVAVAYADRKIVSNEFSELRRISAEFGFTPEQFERIRAWGKAHMELVESAQSMLETLNVV